LSETLTKKYPQEFDVTVQSTPDDLEDALIQTRYDVLLLDPLMYTPRVNLNNARLVLLLTDDEEKVRIDSALAGFGRVAKYQRITDIAKTVREKLTEVPAADARTIMVFSPRGGVGVTTVAAALAFQYAKSGMRTLYINLEAINSTPLFFECRDKGLLDIVMPPLNETGNVDIMSRIKEDSRSRVMYLPLFNNCDDLSLITEDGLRVFFRILADSGCFDVIVADTQHDMDSRLWAMFNLSDYIVLVHDLSETGILKMNFFCAQNSIFESNKSKMRLVYNKKPARWSTPDSDIPLLGEVKPQADAAYREMIEKIVQEGLIMLPG